MTKIISNPVHVLLICLSLLIAAAAIIWAIWYFGPEQAAQRYCHRTAARVDQTLCMRGQGFGG